MITEILYFYSQMNLFIVVVGGVIKFVLVINVILILNVDVLKMNIVNGILLLLMYLLMKVKIFVFKILIVINVNYGINIAGNSLIQTMTLISNVEMNHKNLLLLFLLVILYVRKMKCVSMVTVFILVIHAILKIHLQLFFVLLEKYVRMKNVIKVVDQLVNIIKIVFIIQLQINSYVKIKKKVYL